MSVDITTLTSIRTNLSDEFQRLPPDVRERYPEVALAVQVALQISSQVQSRVITALRLFFQTLHDNGLNISRDLGH